METPAGRGVRQVARAAALRLALAVFALAVAVSVGAAGEGLPGLPGPLADLTTRAAQPLRSLVAAAGRHRAVAALRAEPGWSELAAGDVVVRYRAADEPVARLVAAVGNESWARVSELLGHRPSRPAIVVVHPDRTSLRAAFGWGEGERALGVYSSGVIRLLSPRVWIPARDARVVERVFRSTGPVAHELAHLVLDDATAGNYPHWFSEGVAQWVEDRISGYRWIEPTALKGRQPYPYERLAGDFEGLPNQALAYRQAFLLVEEFVRTSGDDAVARLVAELGRGRRFEAAYAAVAGESPRATAARAWRKPLEAERTPLAP